MPEPLSRLPMHREHPGISVRARTAKDREITFLHQLMFIHTGGQIHILVLTGAP